MKISEIIQLLKAGYTKAEIAELAKAAEQPIEDPPGESAEPEAAPEEAETGADFAAELDKVKHMISGLTTLIQKQNIHSSQLEPDTKDDAVDILGSIINNGKDTNNGSKQYDH